MNVTGVLSSYKRPIIALFCLTLIVMYIFKRYNAQKNATLSAAFSHFTALRPLQKNPFPIYITTNEAEVCRTYTILARVFPHICQSGKRWVVIGPSGFFLPYLVATLSNNRRLRDKEISILLTDSSPRLQYFWQEMMGIITRTPDRLTAFNRVIENFFRNGQKYALGNYEMRIKKMIAYTLIGLDFWGDPRKYAFIRKMMNEGNFKFLLVELGENETMKKIKSILVQGGWKVALLYTSNLKDCVPHVELEQTRQILSDSETLGIRSYWEGERIRLVQAVSSIKEDKVLYPDTDSTGNKSPSFSPSISEEIVSQNMLEITMRVCDFLGERKLLRMAFTLNKIFKRGLPLLKASLVEKIKRMNLSFELTCP